MTYPCIRPPPSRSSLRKHSAVISWRTSRAAPEPPSWKGVVTHKRTIVIPLRLHLKELEHLTQQAALAGLSREAFLRSLILGMEIRPRPCVHHAELIRQVAGLCNNANQLARVANTYEVADSSTVEEMTRLAQAVWNDIKELW